MINKEKRYKGFLTWFSKENFAANCLFNALIRAIYKKERFFFRGSVSVMDVSVAFLWGDFPTKCEVGDGSRNIFHASNNRTLMLFMCHDYVATHKGYSVWNASMFHLVSDARKMGQPL